MEGQVGKSTSGSAKVNVIGAGGAIVSFGEIFFGTGGDLTSIGTYAINTLHEINVGLLGSKEYNIFLDSGNLSFMSILFDSN